MRNLSRNIAATLTVACAGLACEPVETTGEQNVVDIDHTGVERQYIGNCWVYAQASWVEAMNKAATGTEFDVSQSYWTYWHWWDQIVFEDVAAIETGGNETIANKIIEWRGLVSEADFVPEDAVDEGSKRQAQALPFMDKELKEGRLKTKEARKNRKLVRQVLNEAWELKPEIVKWMNSAFGADGSKTFLSKASAKGSPIIRAADFPVRYTDGAIPGLTEAVVRDTHLLEAMAEWTSASYPEDPMEQRHFQIRVQRALHDGNPVTMSWSVDFNAMDDAAPRRGAFHLAKLKEAGTGKQGPHMVVVEDYQVKTRDFGVLPAGVVIDPSTSDGQKKLDAALKPSSELEFFRVKNSWGALRDDRSFVPGFPGYHDLYVDYLNGPIKWCPDVSAPKTDANCSETTRPLQSVRIPLSY